MAWIIVCVITWPYNICDIFYWRIWMTVQWECWPSGIDSCWEQKSGTDIHRFHDLLLYIWCVIFVSYMFKFFFSFQQMLDIWCPNLQENLAPSLHQYLYQYLLLYTVSCMVLLVSPPTITCWMFKYSICTYIIKFYLYSGYWDFIHSICKQQFYAKHLHTGALSVPWNINTTIFCIKHWPGWPWTYQNWWWMGKNI